MSANLEWDDDRIAESIAFHCDGSSLLHRVDAIAVATLVREDMQAQIDRIAEQYHEAMQELAADDFSLHREVDEATQTDIETDDGNEWFELAVQWRLKANTLQAELDALRAELDANDKQFDEGDLVMTAAAETIDSLRAELEALRRGD